MVYFIKSIFMVMFFLVTFKVFANLPFSLLYQVSSVVAILFLLVFSVLYFCRKRKLYKLDIIVLVTLFYILVTSYQAYIVFGQPVIYGLLTQRTSVFILSGVFIFYALQRGFVTLQYVETLLFIISFVLLIVYLYFYIFADASKYLEYSFVRETPLRGYVYKFSHTLVIYLFIYSFFQLSIKKYKIKYIISNLLAFIYLFGFVQKRVVIFSLVLTLFLYLLKNFSFSKFVINISILTLISFSFILMLYEVNPEYIDKYFILFKSAFEVLVGGESADSSANIRGIEIATALPYIYEQPLFGNGALSNQWESSTKDSLGYFYPSDIGLIGNLFTFGIIGVFIVYLPLLYALIFSRKNKLPDTIFIKAIKYSLFFYFLQLFIRGENITNPAFQFFFVYILFFDYKYKATLQNLKIK